MVHMCAVTPVEMGDTIHGRFLAGKKKELIAALSKSTKVERDTWRVKMDFMDIIEADDDGEEKAA